MHIWLGILTVFVLGLSFVVALYLWWLRGDYFQQESRLEELEEQLSTLVDLQNQTQEVVSFMNNNFSEFCETTAEFIVAQSVTIQRLSDTPAKEDMN